MTDFFIEDHIQLFPRVSFTPPEKRCQEHRRVNPVNRKRFRAQNEIYFMLMLSTDGAGNGPASKKKLKSQKKKKRKRYEEEEEEEGEEEFPAVTDICRDTEDNRDHHQLKTEQTGRNHSHVIETAYPPLTHFISRNQTRVPR